MKRSMASERQAILEVGAYRVGAEELCPHRVGKPRKLIKACKYTAMITSQP